MGHEKERSTMEVDREVYFSEQLHVHVHLIHNLAPVIILLKKITKKQSRISFFFRKAVQNLVMYA